MNDKSDYYKAYENRYKLVHEKKHLWSSQSKTLEVEQFIGLDKNIKILDLGCGEGRDAINLLNQGYNITALDYSNSAINKCRELCGDKYKDNFIKFDIFNESLNKNFKKIYSISVLHMFLLQEHRQKYFEFIYNHLEEEGEALITVLGDGHKNSSTDINAAFNIVEKKILNSNKNIMVTNTSCKIVNWNKLISEVEDAKLKVVRKWISYEIPEFYESMCIIIKK